MIGPHPTAFACRRSGMRIPLIGGVITGVSHVPGPWQLATAWTADAAVKSVDTSPVAVLSVRTPWLSPTGEPHSVPPGVVICKAGVSFAGPYHVAPTAATRRAEQSSVRAMPRRRAVAAADASM